MALEFGEITTNSDGTGTSIDLGEVNVYQTILANNNFNKSLPLTTASERLNVNLFGTFRRIRVQGNITGSAVSTFQTQINAWFGERTSTGRYIRGRFDSTARKVVIESANIPESVPTDAIIGYELVLIEGSN